MRKAKTKNIKSFEELVAAIGQVAEGKAEIKDIKIARKSLTVDVKVNGDSWDQRIDYRGAQFIQGIQKQINQLYKQFSQYLPGEPPVIKVRVRKGSNILAPDWIQVANHALDVMGPEYITISVIYAVSCFTGLALYWRKQQRIENTKTLNIAESSIAALRDISKKHAVNQIEAEQPIRQLAKSLADNDSISVGKQLPLPVAVARTLVSVRNPRSAKEGFPCDGEYLLCKINLKNKKRSMVLELEQGDKQIQAYTEHLPDSVAQILLDMVKSKKLNNDLPFSIELQIDVFCTKKGIKYGSILALGQPRAGIQHWTLAQLPPKHTALPLLRYIVEQEEPPPASPDVFSVT